MTSGAKQESKIVGRLAGFEYFTLSDYGKLLWRHRMKIVMIPLVVTFMVAVVAHKMPNEYQAVTTIVVDPGKVPDTYVKSTATIDANQRLSILEEQILSDTRLGQIADELGLYRSLKAKQSRAAVMGMMRKEITVDPTVSAPPARALKSFNVTFTAGDPVLAAKVSNRLASLFIEENLKVREQQVMGTADFFGDQMEKAKEDVDEKAQKLASLKSQYASDLPEAQNLHLQALTTAQLAVREEADALARAEQQKSQLDSLLASSPEVVDMDADHNTGLEAQLEHLQGDLDQLRAHYGPQYPDVLGKEADIRTLKDKMKALEEQGKSDQASGKKHQNPAIQSQIDQAEEQIRKHQAKEAELQAQIKFHIAAIGGVPAVQEQLAAATNELSDASERYKRLQDRKFGADMFSDVEARQQAERFVLLEPAQPPQAPVAPNRPLIVGAAAAVGLILALAVIVVIELFDPAVKTEREVLDRLRAPLLGEIPRLDIKHRHRRRFWSLGATVIQA